MSARQPLVAANWKMNGTLASLRPLVDAVRTDLDSAAEVVICPPTIYLAEVAGRLQGSRIALGAQNVSEYEAGAYTGEVSAAMLKDDDRRFESGYRHHLMVQITLHQPTDQATLLEWIVL